MLILFSWFSTILTSIKKWTLQKLNPSYKVFSTLFERSLKFLAFILIGFYRSLGTQFFGGNCRFEPSCSSYALKAFETHSFFTALKLTLIRLSKCHPLGSYGWDPVPDAKSITPINCCSSHILEQKKAKDKWTEIQFSDINSSRLEGVLNGK